MNIELMKRKRKELGLTQKDLADKCGLSKNTIYNYENGKSEPTLKNLTILANFFNVSELELMLKNDNDIIIENNNFDNTFDHLENKFLKKIEQVLIKKYKNITTINLDNKKVSQRILTIFKNVTNKKIVYSNTLDKVIFFDSNREKISIFDFFIIEQYILNIISMIENIDKNNAFTSDINNFINLLNIETEKMKIEKSKGVFSNELERTLAIFNKFNSLDLVTENQMSFIRGKYKEIVDNMDHNYSLVSTPFNEHLKNQIVSEYEKLEKKYSIQIVKSKKNTENITNELLDIMKRKNKEGGSDE